MAMVDQSTGNIEIDDADPFASAVQSGPRELTISDSAVERLKFLLDQEENKDQMLRVTVSGGGCSGYQYAFTFDGNTTPDDHVFERGGVKVVTDDASLNLLAGSEVDYVDDLIGAFFQVRNPNATSSCGCGTSFAV